METRNKKSGHIRPFTNKDYLNTSTLLPIHIIIQDLPIFQYQ